MASQNNFDPDAYLKAKPKAPQAPFDPDAYLRDFDKQQSDPSPMWDAAKGFGWGALHPMTEVDPNDPQAGAEQAGQWVPAIGTGIATSLVAPEALGAQTAYGAATGAVTGAFAPAKNWKDRVIHTGEGAVAGAIPAPLSKIPRKYWAGVDSLLTGLAAHALHARPLYSIATGLGAGMAHHALSPWFAMARHLALNPALMGKAAATVSDETGFTGDDYQGP